MLYLNSQKIPELAGLNFAQRMEVIRKAADNLSAPKKITLNIIKLLIIFPLFLLIARLLLADSDTAKLMFGVVLLLIAYPVITRLITFALCRHDFARIRQQLYPH
jgi:hypothetical protein